MKHIYKAEPIFDENNQPIPLSERKKSKFNAKLLLQGIKVLKYFNISIFQHFFSICMIYLAFLSSMIQFSLEHIDSLSFMLGSYL